MTDNHPLLLTSKFMQIQYDDCDCACSDTSFYLTTKSNTTGNFTTLPETHLAELPNNFHLAFSPFAPASPSVLNLAAWQRYQTFTHQSQPLSQPIDHELAAQNLLMPEGAKLQIQPTSPETLTVWLHVTNACNLACPYCYVKKSSAYMDETTGKQVLEQLFNTAQQEHFKRLKLKYAGGEATLHFKLIRSLHDYAQQLATNTEIELTEVVLSNGVVIRPEMADWLAVSGIKLMVSVDGIGEIHDYQRPTKQGKGTFNQIEQTLTTILLPRGIKPSISVTVTQHNAKGLAEVVAWILNHELPFTLNFYREHKFSAQRQDFILEETAIINGMKAAYCAIEQRLPQHSLLNSLLDKVQTQAHTHTCGVGQGYVVVTHTGQLAQCQMHLDRPISQTIHADTLLPQLANGRIRNLSVEEKIDCHKCVYRYRCTGGCPLETHRTTGQWHIKSPNCAIYQTLYPEVLRLEGLRLLKVHGFLS